MTNDDMREAVARAIQRKDFPLVIWERIDDKGHDYYAGLADKAIAAAEPALRRKYRAELLDELIDHAIANVPPLIIDPHGGTLQSYVVGYIDSRRESE